MQRLVAETFGTFALVFAGTGAIVIDQVTGGAVSHVGIAITFGLIVLAMIYAIGDISGAHLNPAVTLGFFAAGRFPGRSVLPYIVSQSVGAFLASASLRLMFPENATLGATLPRDGAMQSFVLEIILTCLLMFVVLCVSSGAKEKGITAGIAVGSVITLEAMFAGPICGASMNPIRSLAPAIVAWRIESLWVYLTAPTLGTLAGVLVFRCIQEPAARIAPASKCFSSEVGGAVLKGKESHERSETESVASK
ncbi:MAG TPA: aquaporin [Gemmataceae bacterium]|nr:aquaporin [Gemmataceae bacterium]